MIDNPYFRSLYGHPLLPAGYNSAPNAGDELAGAGYNDACNPVYFDSFIGFGLLIITDEMLTAFKTEHRDLVIPRENDTIVFPHEPETLAIRRRA